MPAKTIQAPNLARSAMAPEIRATVMIAKTAWKATKAIAGMGRPAVTPAERRRHQALEAEEVERVAEQAGADVVAEGHRVAVEHPEDADQRQRAEAHHHHVQDALGADHAAVEERQAWGHQQHERGAGEDPGGVAGVDHGNLLRVSSAKRPQAGTRGDLGGGAARCPGDARETVPIPCFRRRRGRVSRR